MKEGLTYSIKQQDAQNYGNSKYSIGTICSTKTRDHTFTEACSEQSHAMERDVDKSQLVRRTASYTEMRAS